MSDKRRLLALRAACWLLRLEVADAAKRRGRAAEARVEAAQEAVVFKAAEWMNFHETAMRDPFEAEREVIGFCRSLAAVLAPSQQEEK